MRIDELTKYGIECFYELRLYFIKYAMFAILVQTVPHRFIYKLLNGRIVIGINSHTCNIARM